MKIKHFESVCMYLPIIIISVLLGAQVRINIINKGGDDFTANIFFLTVICVGLVIYAGITLFLHTVYDIAIKIFVNRKNPVLVSEYISAGSTIKDIGEDFKTREEIKFNDRLDVALKYTQQQFALYTSVEELQYLCEYITLYSKKEKIQDVIPVAVHTLSNTDLYHFGWNIWRHFDKRPQYDIAIFLKDVFAEAFKLTEPVTIKSHLKDDELKGIIKIKKDLSA